MATTCPIDLDVARLREEVRVIYARVATAPGEAFHFHRGPEYAVSLLGYEADELAALPADSTAAFAGVANPHAIGRVAPGSTVLDIGCGAGMDLLVAARRVGPEGRAIGVDMTEEMARTARASARRLGLENVEVRLGDALHLPVDDESVDVIISNGVINLTPDKERAFAEAFRTLKTGGRLQLGDIVVASELSEGIRRDIDLWTG